MLASAKIKYFFSSFCTLFLLSDFPRPPKNLRLEEEVPGTVTLQWDHTPDLADDDEGAHYVILKRDTSTASWFTVAERVFSSKYTVTGLLPGRKYYFRVIVQNSIGDSDPLDSKEPLIIAKEKGEKCFHQYTIDQHVRFILIVLYLFLSVFMRLCICV